MLRLEPIEFLLRTIPEGFLYLLGVYVFSKIRINKINYITASLITAVALYFIRLLPIDYGVHTILIILFIIFLSMFYNKFDSIQSIKSTIIIFIIQFISEGINMLVLTSIPNLELDYLFSNAFIKNFLGIPSLIITLIVVMLFYDFYKKKDEIKDV